MTCQTDSDNGAEPIVSISCVENTCQAVSLPDALVTDSGASVPCVNGLVLNTQSQNSCSVKCAPGYRGIGGIIYCSETASNNDPVTARTDCVQNVCLPFSFGSAYVTPEVSVSLPCTCGLRARFSLSLITHYSITNRYGFHTTQLESRVCGVLCGRIRYTISNRTDHSELCAGCK